MHFNAVANLSECDQFDRKSFHYKTSNKLSNVAVCVRCLSDWEIFG
jgi:hypothetical protein